MKLLLEENQPKKLKKDFQEDEIYTVRDQGRASRHNGELLQLMIENGFDVRITFEKNLHH
jgi:hypothetical protein